MGDHLINMYSDTVTKPTAAMRQAIANADVGDDMSGEDPTVNRLEALMCKILGKEASVFACSGTQSNQMAVRTHCEPGDELLIAESGHIACSEAGGPAALSGVTCRTLPSYRGTLDRPGLEGKVRVEDQHLCRTKLVCVENPTNGGGGFPYPIEQLQRVGEWARSEGVKVHMDGARLFNAVVATSVSAEEICQHVDTVSICFSKGLGCPMGSILAGSTEDIYAARRARKLFGGALRQSGVVAAAAIYAMEHNVERLQEDHDNAHTFANGISDIEGIKVNANEIETNLVFFDIDPDLGTAAQLKAQLYENGLKVSGSGRQRLRAVAHLDVSHEDVVKATAIVRNCVEAGFSDRVAAVTGPYAQG